MIQFPIIIFFSTNKKKKTEYRQQMDMAYIPYNGL